MRFAARTSFFVLESQLLILEPRFSRFPQKDTDARWTKKAMKRISVIKIMPKSMPTVKPK